MTTVKPFPTRAWYAAGWSHELASGTPLRRKLVGREVVLFRAADGTAKAIDALCPHRGADLGLGKVIGDSIQCPFHGWRFDGRGACTLVPSQRVGDKVPRGASVRSHPVVEQQDILWIWMDERAPGDIAPPRYYFMEPGYGRGMRRVKDIAVLADAPFVSIVENAIDNTHPPFIHPGTLAGEPEYVAHQAVKFDEDMRGYRGQLAPDDGIHDELSGTEGLLGLSRRLMGVTKLDRERCYFRFDLGGVVYFYDRFQSGHEQVGFVAVTPADETHTWFFGEHVRSFVKNRVLDLIIRKWMRQLNGEDIWHVERLLSSRRPHGLERPVSVLADVPSLAFRRVFFNALRRESDEDGRSTTRSAPGARIPLLESAPAVRGQAVH